MASSEGSCCGLVGASGIWCSDPGSGHTVAVVSAQVALALWVPSPRLPPSSGLAYLVLQLQHLLPELLQLLAGQRDDLLQLLLQHLLAVADGLQLCLQGLDSLLAAGREAGLGHGFKYTHDNCLPRSPHGPHPPTA